jgi:hypothetical protein
MLGTAQLTYFGPCCTPCKVLSTFCSHTVSAALHTDDRRFCYEMKFNLLVLVLILLEYFNYDMLCCCSHGSSVGIVTRLRTGSWGFKSRQRSDRLWTYPPYQSSIKWVPGAFSPAWSGWPAHSPAVYLHVCTLCTITPAHCVQ